MIVAMFMQRFDGQTYALMRIVSGFLFLWHGASKLLDFPKPSGAPDWVIYTAGPIELIGGTLIMLGLFTRWTAFVCSGMAAAAFYCFVFLYISANGAGMWSIDGARSKS